MLSIEKILPRARQLYPDQPALVEGEEILTFTELSERVDSIVQSFEKLGLVPGDRLAVLDFNSARYLEMYYAAAQGAFVLVPLNSRLSVPELAFAINDCKARAIYTSEPFHGIESELRSLCPDLEVWISDSGGRGHVAYESLVLDGGGGPGKTAGKEESYGNDDTISHIFYTSGTTGTPKGVCLTRRNMSASAADALVGLGLNWTDRWLHAAPMFHLVDAWAIWAMPILGAPQIPLHFTPSGFFARVERDGATATALPPTLINLLCDDPAVTTAELSSLRLVMYGGSAMPIGLLRRARRTFPETGFTHAFGTTETSGILTLLRADDSFELGEGPVATGIPAGHAVPSTTLTILDDAGAQVDRHVVGEVAVAGPRVMQGYWEQPVASEAALRGGWYRTGDLGFLDERSYLHVVDRKKDMIISGGENVYPAEVENLLSTHPGVLECAVVGLPHDLWGEVVHAVVVLAQPGSATKDELIEFCRGRLAGYKLPKAVTIASSLPKTGTGKLAKRVLRDELAQSSAGTLK